MLKKGRIRIHSCIKLITVIDILQKFLLIAHKLRLQIF